jgi:hypothetical protein
MFSDTEERDFSYRLKCLVGRRFGCIAYICWQPNSKTFTKESTSSCKKFKVKVRVTLRLAVYRQSEIFQLNPCGHSPYITSSLTRGWVCVLWACLAFNSQSESHYNWRSVSQSVLVWSPVWGSWPDIYFIWKLLSCLWGGRPLWREDGSVICPVSP